MESALLMEPLLERNGQEVSCQAGTGVDGRKHWLKRVPSRVFPQLTLRRSTFPRIFLWNRRSVHAKHAARQVKQGGRTAWTLGKP